VEDIPLSRWRSILRIAIDSGGTFTDCVYLEEGSIRVLKIFSTPSDPGAAVLEATQSIAGAGSEPTVRHGTTVGTNAMLERKGARVAFITTAGFEDTIAIGRQARTSLFNWFRSPLPAVVPRELRFGVDERVSAEGVILRSPSDASLVELRETIRGSDAEAIALSLLFAFVNPENERRVMEALEPLGLPISVSHRILPEFREFERASTVVTNAYLAPKVSTYLNRLGDKISSGYTKSSLQVMQSSGGIIAATIAAEEPVRTVLSGPAGGVIGAYHLGRLAGFDKLIGFDMGGTSTDVSLMDATRGGPQTTSDAIVSEMPISVPMLDIHTVGAGGGSIAQFDEGGALRVGPESAGSVPGPICYGKGEQPTVTDANLALGRLDPDLFLGGKVRLDDTRVASQMEAARGKIESLEKFASGILLIAETAMEKAIRVISIERGYDTREFTLVCFGGAGPLHAGAIARSLRIPRVLVPLMPGALSAVGILLADTVRDYSRTVMLRESEDHKAAVHLDELRELALEELRAQNLEGEFSYSLDVRYEGQGYELNLPQGTDYLNRFHDMHQKRYGYSNKGTPVEIVNLRVRVTVKNAPINLPVQEERPGDGSQAFIKMRSIYFDGSWQESRVYQRDLLHAGDVFAGPALITEYSSTTVLPPDFMAHVDHYGNLILESSAQ
jgi:N-methylhydantoinase A